MAFTWLHAILPLNTLLASLCFSILGTYIFPNFTSLWTFAQGLNVGHSEWPTWAIILAGAGTALHLILCLLQLCVNFKILGYALLFTAVVDAASYIGILVYQKGGLLCAGVATKWSSLQCESQVVTGVGMALFIASGILQLVHGFHKSNLMGGGSANSLGHGGQKPRRSRLWKSTAEKDHDAEAQMEHARMLQREEDSDEEHRSRIQMSRR